MILLLSVRLLSFSNSKETVFRSVFLFKTHSIITAFSIEPYHPDFPSKNSDFCRPIRGIMTTYGYTVPDPTVPNRLTIWFTGGKIEPNDDDRDVREWKQAFASPAGRTLGEKAACLVAKLLMGATVPTSMEKDGSMAYEFTRPLGGHGLAYVDIIYVDKSLRILRGHKGTLFAFVRVPDHANQHEQAQALDPDTNSHRR